MQLAVLIIPDQHRVDDSAQYICLQADGLGIGFRS
jgi:hypothetical protein